MSLEPGTRIPISYHSGPAPQPCPAYWRGLVEGGVLGIIMGSLVTACCLALAWSHWG